MIGCAAKGEVVNLNLGTGPPNSQEPVKKKNDVSVVVLPFEDARPDQGRLGTRSHFWGGRTYFDVPGGKPSETIAEAVAEYLAERRRVSADVVLTGKVLGLAVDADSKFARTKIAAKTKLAVQGRNAADESVVRMTLNGSGSDSVFWFDPKDAEKLLNEVLSESLEKLVLDTRFDNHVLRLK